MTPHDEQERKNTTNRSSFPQQPEERELSAEDRALWELLGHARQPATPSPYFTRRVLREVAFWEEEEKEAADRFRGSSGGWWRRVFAAGGGWRPRFAAAAAGVVLAGLFGFGLLRMASVENDGGAAAPFAQTTTNGGEGGDELGLVPESLSDRDLAVIADLDDLLDNQENRAWLEDDSAS